MGRKSKAQLEDEAVVEETAAKAQLKEEVVEAPEEVEEERIELSEDVYLTKNVDGTSVLVECVVSNRSVAAQDAYAYLEATSEFGEVILKNEECGTSMLVKDIDKFPVANRKCLCGNRKHAMVKYKFIKASK